jgi:hypothetical protein
MIDTDDSYEVLHHHLLIMIIVKPKGAERAMSLNLLMMILMINLKRVKS